MGLLAGPERLVGTAEVRRFFSFADRYERFRRRGRKIPAFAPCLGQLKLRFDRPTVGGAEQCAHLAGAGRGRAVEEQL